MASDSERKKVECAATEKGREEQGGSRGDVVCVGEGEQSLAGLREREEGERVCYTRRVIDGGSD